MDQTAVWAWLSRDRVTSKISSFPISPLKPVCTRHWWGHGEPIHVSAVPIYENVMSGEINDVRFTDITAGVNPASWSMGKRKADQELEFQMSV
jgi:hypothetical protein